MRDCRKLPTPQLSAKGSTGSLKQVLGNQNSNLGDVEERLKQNEDQIKHIDDTIGELHKTVTIFEGRHVKTVEKMKEVQEWVSGQA